MSRAKVPDKEASQTRVCYGAKSLPHRAARHILSEQNRLLQDDNC